MKNTVLQDSLTFETFTPDEVLKRALKFEQDKQTTQDFQKSYANTANARNLPGWQVKKKQELNMEVGKRGGNKRRPNKEPYKRRTWDAKSNRSETVYKVWKTFRGGTFTKLSGNGLDMQKLQQAKSLCSNVSFKASQRSSREDIQFRRRMQPYEMCQM